MRREKYDVLVVGAGPAGLAAAIGARETGAGKVLLVDRDVWLGGILQQCIHPGFGLEVFKKELTGPEYAHRYIGRMKKLSIDYLVDTTVVEIVGDRRVILSSAASGIRIVEAGAIVLAMGCRERTRAHSKIAGFRAAGVFTAGTAQRLINIDGLMVGSRIVIVGSGDIGLIMARRCTLEGAQVRAMIEKLPFASGLNRNVAQCVRDFQIPLHLGHQLTFIEGKRRVSGVRFRETVGRPGMRERSMGCDTVLLSVGLIPEIELVKHLNIPLDERTGGPVVDNIMQTSAPGFFACGNLVQVYDLVDWVSMDGYCAGKHAALCALGLIGTPGREVKVEGGENIKSIVPQVLCEYPGTIEPKDVLYVRVGRVFRNPVFLLKNRKGILCTFRMPYAVPSEMILLNLSRARDTLLEDNYVRIEVQEANGTQRAHAAGGVQIGISSEYISSNGSIHDSYHCTPTGTATEGNRDVLFAQRVGEAEVTCVVCPNSCRVRVYSIGGKLNTKGAECARGSEYALREVTDPRRLYTSTVKVVNGEINMVSVRSSKPIRKGGWEEASNMVKDVEVGAPVYCGQVVVKDFLEKGIDLVATKDVQTVRS